MVNRGSEHRGPAAENGRPSAVRSSARVAQAGHAVRGPARASRVITDPGPAGHVITHPGHGVGAVADAAYEACTCARNFSNSFCEAVNVVSPVTGSVVTKYR